ALAPRFLFSALSANGQCKRLLFKAPLSKSIVWRYHVSFSAVKYFCLWASRFWNGLVLERGFLFDFRTIWSDFKEPVALCKADACSPRRVASAFALLVIVSNCGYPLAASL